VCMELAEDIKCSDITKAGKCRMEERCAWVGKGRYDGECKDEDDYMIDCSDIKKLGNCKKQAGCVWEGKGREGECKAESASK